MASQTGTLKFRQSDGTYTELYPKTTIAQVDGLQTQLDSINTSLQNKVELNRQYMNGSGSIALLNRDYGLVYTSKNNLAQLLLRCNDEDLWFTVAAVSRNKNIQLILKLPDDNFPQGQATLYSVYNGEAVSKVLATQDYVTNAITGAINASY